MKEKIKNRIKDYEMIKQLNEIKIVELENENDIIDMCLKDINKIVDGYENKILELEEKLRELEKVSKK